MIAEPKISVRCGLAALFVKSAIAVRGATCPYGRGRSIPLSLKLAAPLR